MMWLPGQGTADWADNVAQLVDVDPDHVSLYLLELYPNAPLREEMARSGWSLAPDEDAAEMYLAGLAALDAAGYAQYEISNVSRAGRESRHNLKYWTDGEWLGLGCGAHSTRGGTRWKNVSSTTEYVERSPPVRRPPLNAAGCPPTSSLEDALFTGLRLTDGVDIGAVGDRYGVDVWDRFGRGLQPFVDEGLLRRRRRTHPPDPRGYACCK